VIAAGSIASRMGPAHAMTSGDAIVFHQVILFLKVLKIESQKIMVMIIYFQGASAYLSRFVHLFAI